MVCTVDDLQEWKDFPKGLRVLLLDHDSSSASEIRSKLEEMEYVGEIVQKPHFGLFVRNPLSVTALFISIFFNIQIYLLYSRPKESILSYLIN